MYCENCGVQLVDNELYCPNCGKRTTIADTHAKNAVNVKNNKVIISTVIVTALVLVVTLLVNIIGNSGYKKTLNNYYKAHEYPEYYKNHDNPGADLLYNSVFSQYWIDLADSELGGAYDRSAEHIRVNLREWECGFNNIKITYKINGEKRATKKQLEELEEDIYHTYAYYVYDRDDFQITDAYVLDIDFTVKGDKDKKTFYYPHGLLIIKENGEWRIPRGRINCSFYDSGFSSNGEFCER